MLITKTGLEALQTGFSKKFGDAWRDTPEWGSQLAMQVNSSTKIETYGWMARLLKMRKWDGPRLIQNLSTHAYQLENEPWELTVGVDKSDIKDDVLGVYEPLFSELGRQARKWPDTMLKTVIQAGGTNQGFDSLAFFHDAHTLDPSGTQDNNFASTALSAANFAIVRGAMMGYRGEDGEPLGVMPNLLIVPPQLGDTALTILQAEFGANGSTNIQRGQARVLIVPELANEGTTWYLADTTSAIKPLVWQLREPPQLVTKTEPTDDNVFFERQFLWGVDARGAAGYGPWFLMSRATA